MPVKKNPISLMSRAAQIRGVICLAPVLLAFYLPFAPGFAPSPIVNNVSNLLAMGFGVLLSSSFIVFFFCGEPIKRKDNQKADRRVFLFMAPFMLVVFTFMYASLFKIVTGEFIHNFSENEKCHFSREIKKEIQGVKIKRSTLNIYRSEGVPFSWNISRGEYSNLPETFMANIYASQSAYGVRIEGYAPFEDEMNTPMQLQYKKYCTTYWFLNPPETYWKFLLHWY